MPSLTETHRLAQAALGVQTVRRMRAVWSLLDPEDLDGTFNAWLTAVIPLVQAQRSTSAELAAAYLSAFRVKQLGEDFDPVLAGDAPVEALSTSMLVTGPVSIRSNLGRHMSLSAAVDLAETASAGAAMRHTLNGGRETILETSKADPRSKGYRRVTSAKACDFCSMLAGKTSGEDAFEAHDGCACGAEPVYD